MEAFTSQSRREATSTIRVDKNTQTVTLDCAFCGGCAPCPVPAIGLDGAILERGGKGGSVTLASVRGGAGAKAGGKEYLSMANKRLPTRTGSM